MILIFFKESNMKMSKVMQVLLIFSIATTYNFHIDAAKKTRKKQKRKRVLKTKEERVREIALAIMEERKRRAAVIRGRRAEKEKLETKAAREQRLERERRRREQEKERQEKERKEREKRKARNKREAALQKIKKAVVAQRKKEEEKILGECEALFVMQRSLPKYLKKLQDSLKAKQFKKLLTKINARIKELGEKKKRKVSVTVKLSEATVKAVVLRVQKLVTAARANEKLISEKKRIKISPLARKTAKELGIDWKSQKIEGSGPGGRRRA